MNYLETLIGIPFIPGGRGEEGLDCWGLVQRVFREIHEAELPDYPGVSPEDTLRIARIIRGELGASWSKLASPEPWCAVTLSGGSVVHHVGIFTPEGSVLHSVPGRGSVCQNVVSLRANGLTIAGFYKLNSNHFL